MDAIVLNVPKQIPFTQVNGVQKLTLFNPTQQKLAVKIRTNHKTALHIHPTHDFIQPNSKKDVIVKLLQLHQGVKLEINYTIATEDMIAKGDSKMVNVDKKDIKKQITIINVSQVKASGSVILGNSGGSLSGSGVFSDSIRVSKDAHSSQDLNSSFMTVAPVKNQPVSSNKTVEKKMSLNISKQPTEVVVQQRLQQDEQQFEQNSKKLKQNLAALQSKILTKKQSIFDKRAQLEDISYADSFLPPIALPVIVVAGFLLGSFIKLLLF